MWSEYIYIFFFWFHTRVCIAIDPSWVLRINHRHTWQWQVMMLLPWRTLSVQQMEKQAVFVVCKEEGKRVSAIDGSVLWFIERSNGSYSFNGDFNGQFNKNSGNLICQVFQSFWPQLHVYLQWPSWDRRGEQHEMLMRCTAPCRLEADLWTPSLSRRIVCETMAMPESI